MSNNHDNNQVNKQQTLHDPRNSGIKMDSYTRKFTESLSDDIDKSVKKDKQILKKFGLYAG